MIARACQLKKFKLHHESLNIKNELLHVNATRAVIGRCPWSIRVQIHGWRQQKNIKKNISDTLACGSCTTFWRHLGCRIYYWTYARQLGIYLLNIWSVMRLPSTISSLIYQWNLNKAARSGSLNKKLVSPFNQVRLWTIKWLQDHTNEKDKISGQWVTAEFLLSIVEHAKSQSSTRMHLY